MGLDFAKMGQNLGESLTGNISKAVLVIRKIEIKKQGDYETIDNVKVEDAINDIAGTKVDGKRTGGINDKLMQMAQKTLDNGKTANLDDISKALGAKKYIALELQYNPSSLRLDTTAGRQMSYSGDAGATQVQQYTAPASTTLSCELMFNDVNNMDAFMLGDNPVTGATISNVKNAAASALRGSSFVKDNAPDSSFASDYSVQRQMEGLLSLITVPAARHVIFYWGAMCFRGEMTEVTAKYTMFNKRGYPVRGTVYIQIRQGDSNADIKDPSGDFAYDDTYWIKSFDKTFTDKGKGASVFNQVTNNSFMNLKL